VHKCRDGRLFQLSSGQTIDVKTVSLIAGFVSELAMEFTFVEEWLHYVIMNKYLV
jgi:hypothetical protein